MIQEIKENLLQAVHPDAVVEVQEIGLQSALYIAPDYLKSVCKFLRDDSRYYFDFLANVTAVDYFPQEYFEVVYNLTSIPFQTQLCLKVRVSAERNLNELPEVPSVSEVWRTADWHEREAYDLMGIFFTDHPDLRRILMPEDWVGYPLRKDYQDPETYHNIPIK
ncbi:NADH-quinone oxidoreductase subunit C [Sphingobacterium cellulitidis]|uniref:NADH-quinone oxidoreductase subunit C n=1 Tax=Sphingobacterium cellulitidis TaxID=1768011 RepID=UPI000B945294|nr:NADH-quinone oxidoreductase subunit C [Sphingobacterium cellulitidis]OYD47630.1 NADH-quinone oxidoreductase subunit C [Sphingobacterium cellulitidis]